MMAVFLFSLNKTISDVLNIQKPNVSALQYENAHKSLLGSVKHITTDKPASMLIKNTNKYDFILSLKSIFIVCFCIFNPPSKIFNFTFKAFLFLNYTLYFAYNSRHKQQQIGTLLFVTLKHPLSLFIPFLPKSSIQCDS